MKSFKLEQLDRRELMAANVLEGVVEKGEEPHTTGESIPVEQISMNYEEIKDDPTPFGYQTGGSSADSIPMDTVTYNFSKIEYIPDANADRQEAVDKVFEEMNDENTQGIIAILIG